MKKYFVQNIVNVSMLCGMFAGFFGFEIFTWITGRAIFDIETLNYETLVILTGAVIGILAGVILDFRLDEKDRNALSFNLWVLLFPSFFLFYCLRVAVQPAF